MPTALAISPHLDDAVFSAGGMLTRLRRSGWRIVVATVFSASVANPEGFALACQLDKGLAPDVDYMALRRSEDRAACAVIGAEPIWLPFREAPHRGYNSAKELFGDPRNDDDVVDMIVPAVGALVDQLTPDLLMAPQCIGAHVDHVAVYRAIVRHGAPVSLWADFPYSVRPAHRPSPFAVENAAAAEEILLLSAAETELKARAAAAYTSQLSFQFGGLKAAEVAMKESGHVERYALFRKPPLTRATSLYHTP